MNYKQAFEGLNQTKTDLYSMQVELQKGGAAFMATKREALGGKSANEVLAASLLFIHALVQDMESWPNLKPASQWGLDLL